MNGPKERLLQQLAENQVDALLVTDPYNRRYLSGFTGSAGALLITKTDPLLFVDFRYLEQAQRQALDWQVILYDSFPKALKKTLEEQAIRRVAVESEHMTVQVFEQLKDALELELQPVGDWVNRLRQVKSEEEINHIQRAADIATRTLTEVLPRIKVGVTEHEIALDIDFSMRRLGADEVAFPTIAASGPNSALPHASPGKRKLEQGDLLVLDFGCCVEGYCSDMTRTFSVGPASEEQRNVYGLVLQAQEKGLAACRAGQLGSTVDKTARDVIEDAGFGRFFGHSLGHSVGLEVHEKPRLSKKESTMLNEQMVVTVEPGIYLPGSFGVRIEDLVVVQNGQPIILSTYEKQSLVELD